MDKAGIIVGTNQKCAWLLPWWWRHYSRHNSLPVTFVDFGVSEEVAEWCKERGKYVRLDPAIVSVAPRDHIDPSLVQEWENLYGKNVWEAREGWFFKPFAMRSASYETTIWLDLDCEVCGSLQPILECLGPQAEMGLIRDPGRPGIYNSGVVVYRQSSQLLQDWAEQCLTHNKHLIGDDYVLSPLIDTHRYAFQELPQIYNWMGGMGINTDALIMHWASNWGKLFIETHGGFQDYKNSLLGLI